MFHRLALAALILLPLQACASKGSPTILYSLDGPPLSIAADQGEKRLTGHMERECMLGQGQMAFRSEDLVCLDELETMPNQSGHIAAMLRCSNGELLMLSFRTLGPDQGLGLGRFLTEGGDVSGEPLIFYFHPWEDEAARRLEQEKQTLLDIIAKREKRDEQNQVCEAQDEVQE